MSDEKIPPPGPTLVFVGILGAFLMGLGVDFGYWSLIVPGGVLMIGATAVACVLWLE